MSIGVQSISEAPLGAQNLASSTVSKPPRRRTTEAKADLVNPPEPR